MPFDFDEISEEVRRNPKPYAALAILAVVLIGGGLAYRRMGRERDLASLAKAEAELKAKGLLLASDERSIHGSMACAIRQGFVVAWPKPERGIAAPLYYYCEPWDKPQTMAGDSTSPIASLASDASHTRIATAASDTALLQGTVRVCDVSSGKSKVIREISDLGFPTTVAISADGTRVAHASHREVVVTNVADGKRLFACSSEARRTLAMDASGSWVAVCGNPFMLIGMKGTPQVRKLVVGGKFVLSPEDRETLTDEGVTEDPLGNELPMSREIVECAGFSRDGKWLWCGTNSGLRVYDWNAVTRTSGTDMPTPVFSFTPPNDPPIKVTPFAYLNAQKTIEAIVEENDGKGILFGGHSGRLYRLDLKTGKTRELIRLPGEMTTIRQIVMSADGKTIGLGVHTIFVANFRRPDGRRWAWQIWSYPRLLGVSDGDH